jgi:hypothetical protein
MVIMMTMFLYQNISKWSYSKTEISLNYKIP